MKETLLLLIVAMLVACTSERIRPPRVPLEAFFVGGMDGGTFLHCGRQSEDATVYRCKFYSETDGALVNEGDFVVTKGNPDFNPDDKEIYNGWDGVNIILKDNRTLQKVTLPTAELQQVDFKGTKFSYNPRIFGAVVPSEVNEVRLVPDEKPDFVAPKHVTFKFGLRKQYNEAHLTIFPVSQFIEIMGADKRIQMLTKQKFQQFGNVLKNARLRFDGDIPFIPFRDGNQELQSKVKLANFDGGKGIFFVTHWSFEAGLISNELLYYVFEGLTDDGKYYVVAEMPTNAPFLPENSPDEFEGFSLQDLYDDYKNQRGGERHKEYRDKITSRLNALSHGDYQPSLFHLETMIASLKIEE